MYNYTFLNSTVDIQSKIFDFLSVFNNIHKIYVILGGIGVMLFLLWCIYDTFHHLYAILHSIRQYRKLSQTSPHGHNRLSTIHSQRSQYDNHDINDNVSASIHQV